MPSLSFNVTATTAIYTLSLHDALPIYRQGYLRPRHLLLYAAVDRDPVPVRDPEAEGNAGGAGSRSTRSEEHTSELQSLRHLVCRLLLEKKKENEVDCQLGTYTEIRPRE